MSRKGFSIVQKGQDKRIELRKAQDTRSSVVAKGKPVKLWSRWAEKGTALLGAAFFFPFSGILFLVLFPLLVRLSYTRPPFHWTASGNGAVGSVRDRKEARLAVAASGPHYTSKNGVRGTKVVTGTVKNSYTYLPPLEHTFSCLTKRSDPTPT